MDWQTTKKVLMLVGVLFTAILAEHYIERVEAQESSPKEIAPYKFAELPHGSEVYKIVHQGCELFVVENYTMSHGAVTAAITTGRGCK